MSTSYYFYFATSTSMKIFQTGPESFHQAGSIGWPLSGLFYGLKRLPFHNSMKRKRSDTTVTCNTCLRKDKISRSTQDVQIQKILIESPVGVTDIVDLITDYIQQGHVIITVEMGDYTSGAYLVPYDQEHALDLDKFMHIQRLLRGQSTSAQSFTTGYSGGREAELLLRGPDRIPLWDQYFVAENTFIPSTRIVESVNWWFGAQ
jgi:hypothetical protein